MNKQELVEAISKQTDSSKAATARHLEALIDVIGGALKKGERVQLIGFGTFESRKRAARTARNPRTGAAIKVPATKVPKFSPGQGLKDKVSGAKK